MPRVKKEITKDSFVVVRMIYGRGPEAKERYAHIPSGGMNKVLHDWHAKQDQREFTVASPSSITTCPRVIWLATHGVARTNDIGWGTLQRMMLGRELENLFAHQLQDEGKLLYHWKDDPGVAVDKFKMGEGLDAFEGVPDYLLNLNGITAISDAKTSRSDSFGYVPLEAPEIWEDWGWFKYRLQLTGYFMLAEANKPFFDYNKLPMPTDCHLFSYALDDGVVRREVMWQPTEGDKALVRGYIRRFNEAVASPTMPACTCPESFDNFDVKFCRYGEVLEGDKIALTCCSPDLEPK